MNRLLLAIIILVPLVVSLFIAAIGVLGVISGSSNMISFVILGGTLSIILGILGKRMVLGSQSEFRFPGDIQLDGTTESIFTRGLLVIALLVIGGAVWIQMDWHAFSAKLGTIAVIVGVIFSGSTVIQIISCRRDREVALDASKTPLLYWILQNYQKLRVITLLGVLGMAIVMLLYREILGDSIVLSHWDLGGLAFALASMCGWFWIFGYRMERLRQFIKDSTD